MATIKSVVFEEASGKVGKGLVVRQTVHGSVLAKTPRKTSTPRRSEKQVVVRGQLGNIAANHRLYEGKQQQGFEGKPVGCNEFNMMVQTNYGVNPVFLTKQERLNGGCVVAPYQYCRGSLRSIGVEVNEGGVLVSDIALGSLVIGEETTVAALAAAIISHNTGWEDCDQLTFFYAQQYVDSVTQVPRATMDAWKVVLDISDETVLMTKVTALGFTSISDGAGGYVLGMGQALVNAGASWTHSREDASGSVKVGSQRLTVVSDILADYMGQAAMKRCAESYGGINTKAVYLNPKSGAIEVISGVGSISTGTGGSGSGSQAGGTGSSTGSQTGGQTGGSGDGQTGGQTGGSTETTTVEAPVISGNTSFAESTSVTISAESGAEIRYTIDGSEPGTESTLYSEAITVSETTTVKAVAIKDGVSSTVASKTFTKSAGGDDSE